MWTVLWFAVLAVLLAAETVVLIRKNKKSPAPKRRRGYPLNSADERARKREAHYMSNFWSYDGGEQEEFDE